MKDTAPVVSVEVEEHRVSLPLSLTYAEVSPRRWSEPAIYNSPATGTTTMIPHEQSDLDVDDA